tara:strand:- start:473 stop:715 length:243 start_codon:yes stop_codon:yes gene_type:complete
MLVSAHKESHKSEDLISIEEERFKKLIHNWKESSKEIVNHLSKYKELLGEGKEVNSLMALGAMEVHIAMAMQALKASKIE